jgi:hypothetical protein
VAAAVAAVWAMHGKTELLTTDDFVFHGGVGVDSLGFCEDEGVEMIDGAVQVCGGRGEV